MPKKYYLHLSKYKIRNIWAKSFKSELAKISELRNKCIKNSKNGLLINLFGFSSDFDETW